MTDIRGVRLRPPSTQRAFTDMADPFLADVHVFESQAATLRRLGRVVSLDVVRDHLASGRPIRPGSIHLSVDGAFASTLVAAEILDRHRLPWTFFPIVTAVLDGRVPWPVHLAEAVAVSSNVLDANGALHDLSDRRGKQQFLETAVAAILASDRVDDRAATVMSLRGLQRPDEPVSRLRLVRDRDGGGEHAVAAGVLRDERHGRRLARAFYRSDGRLDSRKIVGRLDGENRRAAVLNLGRIEAERLEDRWVPVGFRIVNG